MTTTMTTMITMKKVIAEVIHINNHNTIQAKGAKGNILKMTLVDSLNPTVDKEEDKLNSIKDDKS